MKRFLLSAGLLTLLSSCAVNHRADEVLICFGFCMKITEYEEVIDPDDAALKAYKRP